MHFDELDAKLRVYETAYDLCVLPDVYMVARIDGRGFTRLTKDVLDFERPFDERFRDLMLETTKHLMSEAGFNVVYGYTESDEISLLFQRDEASFGRKLRKLHSILAGEASAKFTHLLGSVAVFDCRISALPSKRLVVDYFRWRNEDAHRNALSAHCYWLMRNQGASARAATRAIEGKSVADKHEFLFQHGINFNELPAWQRRGIGVWWETYEKHGTNPQTGKGTRASRKRLKVESELPLKDAYSDLLESLVEQAGSSSRGKRRD